MFIVAVVLAVLLALAFGAAGGQKVAGVKSAMDNADHLRFSHNTWKGIGALEVLGAIGLLVGLALWPLGVAAGAGLVLLMAGAVIVHIRNGDPIKVFAPALVLGVLALAEVIVRAAAA
ncbi:DoxX family protein [Actinomadura sp. DC4]|uniref:DoxX family protein n=1 Tax=Actinomadura sp. DC4 TaxID=3055069 RepID=UPI0025B12F19|nr:DoxX family protein [Actinomadura sp. DC4]MDN3352246.1 DoxX family protein [Actinomadura sp. DC4]